MLSIHTLIIIGLCFLLSIVIVIMYYNKMNNDENIEGFEDNSLTHLVNDYESLSNDEQKNLKEKLAKIIGTPVNSNDLIHKTAIPPQRECPESKYNDLDYVKRSSIPPCPEPKPCVCPKVEVSADLCKKQNCPPCPKCDECKKIERIHTPVFITKTITKDNNGNIVNEEMNRTDESDIEPSTTTKSTTTTSTNPTTTTTKAETTITNEDRQKVTDTKECEGVDCALNYIKDLFTY